MRERSRKGAFPLLRKDYMFTIRPAVKDDAVSIQDLFNHKDVIAFLGGFVLKDQILGKVNDTKRCSMFVAELDMQIVGALEIAGRTQAHFMKYGMVAVFPEHRRKRIASSLYAAATFQGILEGRRLFEDTIVGDNPVQFHLLPTIGLVDNVNLQHKTAIGKDIHLFSFDLLLDGTFDKIVSRLSVEKLEKMILIKGSYQADLWEKNQTIYRDSEFVDSQFHAVISSYREKILSNVLVSTLEV